MRLWLVFCVGLAATVLAKDPADGRLGTLLVCGSIIAMHFDAKRTP